MSVWLTLTLAMITSIAVVLLIAIIKNRRAGEDFDPEETPDVIEYMTMMIGVVYAIVLGLAIAGVWEAKGSAEDTVKREAYALHEVSERVAVWPQGPRTQLRTAVNAYVDYAVGKEWDAMADRGELTPHGDTLLADVRDQVTTFTPKTDAENRAAFALADQISIAEEARNDRSLGSGSTLPGLVWFGLIAGGLTAIGMVFALQIQRSPRELILAGLHSSLLAFLLFLVWMLDAPYARDSVGMAEPFALLFPGATG